MGPCFEGGFEWCCDGFTGILNSGAIGDHGIYFGFRAEARRCWPSSCRARGYMPTPNPGGLEPQVRNTWPQP